MATTPTVTIERLREVARHHGVHLDEARAAELLPRVTSLLARLSALAARLPQETAPAPGLPPLAAEPDERA
jgi:hypothetical protein